MTHSDADLVTQSFEIAAERCEDLTPLVYRLLFADHPDMERLFFSDRSGAVKGEMLARVVEAILDFIGERHYSRALIQCEVITHEGYDVPPRVFITFFDYVAAALRQICADDWTPDIEAAWQRTLKALQFYVENPDQYIAPENVGTALSHAL